MRAMDCWVARNQGRQVPPVRYPLPATPWRQRSAPR
jgi:hypothetical protein